MVSLFKVPGPVKDLFDKFPLVQYPAVKQLTPETKSEILKRNYSYSASSSENSSQTTTSFKLGTYNVFQTEDNTFLATDPLCLSIELYLAIKNGIKLPKLNNDHTDQSRNSLFLLSHHSSSNGYLPIYIEEDSKRKSKRLIKDSQSINETLLTSVKSSSELMLITLVDNVIYDYWITSVLFNFNTDVQTQIFQFHDEPAQQRVNLWGLGNLLSQLVYRNGFDVRNPAIARQFQADAYSLITKQFRKYSRAVEFEKQRNYKEFLHAIENLQSILLKRNTRFFNGDVQPGLLDVKISSYVTLIIKFGENHDISKVLHNNGLLVEHAQAVIKYCS
ncbi:unnamed protein product [Wickerhamomyces anomalus]